MNAETPKAEELSLPEAFLLLATNDKDGEPELPAYVLRTTLAGAILAELDLIGAITLEGKHVRAKGTAPESKFQHELELIREKSRPHTPKRWVSILEGRGEVHRVYEVMASEGIVEPIGEKHLGLFKTTRYPEKDHTPEAALLQEVQAALGLKPSGATPLDATLAGAPPPEADAAEALAAAGPASAEPPAAAPPEAATPDATPLSAARASATPPSATPRAARTTALIALLQAAGLLGNLFPEADQERAIELVKNHWPSRAVEDELRLIRLGVDEATI
jgi:hypothetical protein